MRALGLTSCIACIIIGLAAAHAQTLAERFARLSCAIVHISAGYELGTGFFIDSTGTLVTAAHVISRRYCTNNNNPCGLNVLPTYPITVVFSDGHSQQLSDITITDNNRQTAQYDILRISTGFLLDHVSGIF